MAAPSRKLAEIFYELRARSEQLPGDLNKAQSHFGKLTQFVLKNPVAAIAAVGTAMLAVAAKATAMALEVEKGMRRVAIATSGGAEGLKQLRADIEELSAATGRTQAELAQAAALAAKSSGSTVEVGERLRAALELSQATGEDLTGIIENLDTVLDVFSLSSKDSAEALATLFAAAKGRQPITDLFTTIARSGTAINKLGLDLDTVSRALVTLGERLGTPRAAATEFKKLADLGSEGAAAIRQLAAETPKATDALGDLKKAADEANNSAEALSARLRNEFSNALIDLGNRILPLVTKELQGLVGLLDKLKGVDDAIEAQGFLATVISLGPKIGRLDEEGKKGAKGVKELVSEVNRLITAVKISGDLKLADLNRDQLESLKAALTAIRESGKIGDTRFGVGSAITSLLKDIDAVIAKSAEAKTAVSAIPTGTATAGPRAPTAEELERRAKAREEALKREKEAAEALADAERRLADIRQDSERKAAEAGRQFAELQREGARNVAELAGDTVAAIDAQIDDIARTIIQVGFAAGRSIDEIVQAIAANTVHLQAAKKAAEALNGAVQKISITPDQQKKLTTPLQQVSKELDELRKKLEKAGASGKEIDRALSKAAFEKLVKVFQEIGFTLEDAQKKAREFTGAVTDDTAAWANQLAEAANAAFGIATAMAGADNNIVRAIGSTAALLTQVVKVSDAIREAGSLSKLLAQPGGTLTLLGGIGGIVGSVASLFGTSPEEARAREEQLAAQRELVQALDRVRDALGDLAKFSGSGADIAVVRGVSLARTRIAGRDEITGEDILETIPRTVSDVLGELRKLGVGLDDLRQIAADAGITLSESPTIAELQRLQQVLLELDFAAFADTFAGQLNRLQRQFDLFGEAFDEPGEQFKAFVELLNDPKVGAPALFGALQGLETATAEGRTAIQAAIRDLFTKAVAGELTPEDLGGLSLEEFLDALAKLNDQIEAIGKSTGTATAALTRFDKALQGLEKANRQIAVEDIDDPFEQLRVQAKALFDAFPDLAKFFDLSTIEGVKAFGDALPAFIAGLEDGSIAIDGLAADEIPDFIAALLGLESAGDAAEDALLSLADTIANAFSDIDLDALIFGVGDVDRLNQKFEKIGLGAFELGTKAGRDAARAALQELALQDPSLKPLIADLIRSLDALPEIPGAVGNAVAEATGDGERSSIASAAQALTERTGNRMADYLATGVILERQQVALLEQLVDVGRPSTSALFQPPALSTIAPQQNYTTVTGGLEFSGDIIVNVTASSDDPDALGRQITGAILTELAEAVSRKIAADTLQQRRFTGDSRLTS